MTTPYETRGADDLTAICKLHFRPYPPKGVSLTNTCTPQLSPLWSWTVDPAAATTIAAPTNLTATLGGTRSRPQITLRWTDNSNNEANFVVERSGANGTTWKVLTSSLAANTTRYTDKTVVSGGKTYTYRMKATKVAQSSAYSNEASATTK